MLDIFNHLHGLNSKTEQRYLHSVADGVEANCKTAAKIRWCEKSKPKAFNVKYHIQLNGVRTRVCKKFNLSRPTTTQKIILERLSQSIYNKIKLPKMKGKNVNLQMQYLKVYTLN
ncbi:hypothetical protein LSTR_LSTR003986 [Laodelphax striatellus]|uniref:Uncharacterized protein n=1 Tax=Laodelphax striatellus TaxID=195883 RepID=A0A482WF59_LAOST|nr:hypothetical protein LSTR_LSTR003986 [Laodelphax striatellus]